MELMDIRLEGIIFSFLFNLFIILLISPSSLQNESILDKNVAISDENHSKITTVKILNRNAPSVLNDSTRRPTTVVNDVPEVRIGSNETAFSTAEKLKILRAEVRRLATQLKKERKTSKSDKFGKSKENLSDFKESRKWKRRMRKRVQTIQRRLKKLEKKIREPSKTGKSTMVTVQKTTPSKNIAPTVGDAVGENNSTVIPKASKRAKKSRREKKTKALTIQMINSPKESQISDILEIKTTLKPYIHATKKMGSSLSESMRRSKSKAKVGDDGSACETHNDCKPGLCCHRTSLSKALASTDSNASAYSRCVHYALGEGAECAHSCACDAQLHCFRDFSVPTVPPPTPVRGFYSNSTGAKCKKASTSDFMAGIYENAKETFFLDDFANSANLHDFSKLSRNG